MKINTKAEAQSAIDAVARWLSECKCAARPEINPPINETASAELARRWSDTLLDASTADGQGGCKLCQS